MAAANVEESSTLKRKAEEAQGGEEKKVHIELPPKNDETAEKIKTQIEFYFGDSNFRRDIHLKGLAAKNPEGWVELKDIATFKRMRTLTDDIEFIAKSCRSSEFLVVSDDSKRVKRSTDLPEGHNNDWIRSIYSKPYPLDSTWEEIAKFWSTFGTVVATRLRGDANKKFKGSVFVEFKTEDEARRAVEANPSFPKNPADTVMIHKIKKDYMDEKRAESRAKKNALKEKPKAALKADGEASGKKDEIDEKWEKGCIAKFAAVEGVNRFQVKDECIKFGEVDFVELGQGQQEGFIRFRNPAGAKAVVDASAAGKLKVDDKPIAATLVDGDAETEYWNKVITMKKGRKEQGGSRGGRGRGRGRGGRGRGRR